MVNAPMLAGHGERASTVAFAFNQLGPRSALSGERSEDSYRSCLPAEVGRMLAVRRRGRGWSVRQAARRVGCCYGMVGMLETGRRAPSVPLAMDLADAYRLPLEDRRVLLAHAIPGAGRDSPYYQR